MKGKTGIRGPILIGLLAVSLGLYWGANATNTPLEIVFLGLLGALALAASWSGK
jgi:hypothetical protein